MSIESRQSYLPKEQQRAELSSVARREISAAKETDPTLTEGQRFALAVVDASALFPRIIADAKSQVAWKRNKSSYWGPEIQGQSDKEIITRHIAGVLDPDGSSDLEKGYYQGRWRHIESDELLAAKEDMSKKAESWTPREQRDVFQSSVRSVRKALKPYEKGLLEHYLTHTAELPEEKVANVSKAEKTLRRKSRQTLAINTALVGLSYVAGKASADFNVMNTLAEVIPPLESANNAESLAVLGGATFGAYYSLLTVAGFENVKILKKKGISTVAPSKMAYDRAPEEHKALAASAGYAAWHAATEVPIAMGAFEYYQQDGMKGFGEYSLGANVSTLLFMGLAYAGTRLYRKSGAEIGLEELLQPQEKKKKKEVTVIDLTEFDVDVPELLMKKGADIVTFPPQGEQPVRVDEPQTDGANALDLKERYQRKREPQTAAPDLKLIMGEIPEATT